MASQASSSRAGSPRAGEQAHPGDTNQGEHTASSSSGAGAAQPRLASFAEFWPYYVGEHSDP